MVGSTVQHCCSIFVIPRSALHPGFVYLASVRAFSLEILYANFFNLSIQSCKIPTVWKLANIVPVPKAKVFNEASNYRPISLLSVVSKVLEKHISSLILGHLSANCPLSTIQWDFLPARSTGTALASTLFTWFQQLENKREVLAVFFDLN